jgi:O-antigen ligase
MEVFKGGKERYTQLFAHNAILEAATTKGLFGVIGLLAFLLVPALAGVWVIAMFNPISFEVVYVAAVLAGLHYRRSES